jgi:hypothetical protein
MGGQHVRKIFASQDTVLGIFERFFTEYLEGGGSGCYQETHHKF